MKRISKLTTVWKMLTWSYVTGWSFGFKTKGLLLKEGKATEDRNIQKIYRKGKKLLIITIREVTEI